MDISWFGLVNGQTLSCDVNAGAVSECFTYLVSGDLVYITRSEEEISSIAYAIIADVSDGWKLLVLCRLLAVTTAGDVHISQRSNTLCSRKDQFCLELGFIRLLSKVLQI